ncbi:MAG: amidohydrolase [Bacteroidetes bacterium]|nr:MAG: amidohydrolase [Bacteroidota bacterium]
MEKSQLINCLFGVLVFFGLQSCYKGKEVDLVIHNAKIYCLDEEMHVEEAMAIRDGIIVEIGPERQILNKYSSEEVIDAAGKAIYPGLTDSHGHLLSLLQQKLNLNLVGSTSFEAVLEKVKQYAIGKKRKFIMGRGWDQSLWANNNFPDNKLLNELYPDIPVLLFRVDGHAALANDFLLKKAGLNPDSKIEGGEVQSKEGQMTGILLDNAIEEVSKLIPEYSTREKQDALLEIQEELFQLGITEVHEAGIHYPDIELFKSLYDWGNFDLQIYAMLYPTEENFNFVRKNGIYKHKGLLIRSFKVVGDGSLGSRGACLKSPYSDAPHTHGFLTTSIQRMKEVADFALEHGYQMNTHAIGDSTNKILIDLISKIHQQKPDHRWRIEHAQVLSPEDIISMGKVGVFPSVQPCHAVSDQRWAKDRLGEQRMVGAYAYQSILKNCGMIALGTDFPVESFDPFQNIHAAVQRTNVGEEHAKGFLVQEKLSLDDCMKGLTIWSACASFQEHQKGSIEKGKDASFVILEKPIATQTKFRNNFAYQTYIKGKKVYSAE